MNRISKRKTKSNQKPWITQGILKSIRTKTNCYKKFMRTKNTDYYDQYKTCRDRLNSVIKSSKKNYYKEYFLKHQNKSKCTWKGVNQIINNKNKSHQQNISLVENGNVITNEKEVANTFNRYFINVADDLTKKLGNTDTDIYI